MRPGQKVCVCGKAYWPSQAWIHRSCNDKVTTETATHNDDVVTLTSESVVTERKVAASGSEGQPAAFRDSLVRVAGLADAEPVREPPLQSAASRQVQWQRENRERYNAKMRAYRKARA